MQSGLRAVETKGSGLVRSSVMVLAVRISGAALQMLLLGLGVLFFPIDEVGRNGILWTCAILARVGGPLGLDLFCLREMPEVWRAGNTRRFYEKCRSMTISLGTVLGVSCFVLCGVLIALAVFGLFDWSLALCIPIAIWNSAMQRLIASQMRARGQIILSQFLEAILIPVLAVGALLITFAWIPELFVYGQAASIALSTLVIKLAWRCPERYLRTRWITRRQWGKILPLGLGTALSVAASRAPLLFMGSVAMSQAAVYDVGQRIHSSASLASTSASTVLLPRIKGLLLAQDRRLFVRELFATSVTGLVPALLVLGVLVMLGPEGVSNLLGSEYRDAWSVCIVLVVSACVTAVAGLCHGILAMAGRSRTFAGIPAIQLILVVAYGLLFSNQGALSMALFMTVLETLRGIVLLIMMSALIKKIA